MELLYVKILKADLHLKCLKILKVDLHLKCLKRNLGNEKVNLVHIGYVKRASNGLDSFL